MQKNVQYEAIMEEEIKKWQENIRNRHEKERCKTTLKENTIFDTSKERSPHNRPREAQGSIFGEV
jgi:hypothetical protein